MHMQYNVYNWTRGLRPGLQQVMVACDMGSMFEEAKGINPQVVTILRHVDDDLQQFSDTWEGSVQLARRWWSTFIDGTFRDKYAQHTDFVKGYNETLANSQTSEERLRVWMLEKALATVWNDEYRVLPEYSHIRPVLGSAAVGNDIPESIALLTIQHDCALSYHAYMYWRKESNEEPVRPDWERVNLSGRWNTMEEDWESAKPLWVLATEGGAFESALDGWISQNCLGGDRTLYIEAMRTQVREIMATSAWREGRVLGMPVWFTSGGGSRWRLFENTEWELEHLALMLEEELSGYVPPVEPPVEPPVVPPVAPVDQGLLDHLRQVSIDAQLAHGIWLNDAAGLQNRIVDDGVGDTWWAVHREAVTECEGESFTVQAAEHTAMGERRVYVWQEGKEIWYFV